MKSADNPSGHAAVVVPRDTPGVRIVKRWDVLGLRASGTYQVALDDVRVPVGNALTGPGLRILEVGLNASRLLIASTAIGISRRIRDLAIDYAKTKPLRGSTLLNNAVFAAKMGQMEMEIGVMRNQCAAAGRDFDSIMSGPSADFHRAAVQAAAAAGWHVILATARWYQLAERTARELGLTDPVIACSGAEVRRLSDGADLLDVRLPGRFIEELYRMCDAADGTVMAYQDHDVVLRRPVAPSRTAPELRHVTSLVGTAEPDTAQRARVRCRAQ